MSSWTGSAAGSCWPRTSPSGQPCPHWRTPPPVVEAPPEPESEPEVSPDPPAPKKAAPTTRHTGARAKQATDPAREQLIAKTHDFIREHGPVSRKQICVEFDLDESKFKSVIKGLRQKGVTQIGKRGGTKYIAEHGEIFPESGPKTEAERRVHEALDERPLTAAAIAVKIVRPVAEVSAMCEGMARRRVLEKLDTDDPPVRYAQAGSAQ